MVKVKKGDFIEIQYTGKIKLGDKVFDTSDEEIAKTNKIHNPSIKYGPVVACVGESNVLKGLDKDLDGKEIGEDYEVNISPADSFGPKNPKLIKTVSMSLFRKQKMNPYPGLQINAEGSIGTVRSVNGGRVILDFNHPLAGRELIYNYKILKKVEDDNVKVDSLMNFSLAMFGKDNFTTEIKENILKVKAKMELPEQIQKMFEEKVKELIPGVKKVEFLVEKPK
jgi:FKBP-type peptidyl-prolyl cis-trans isomerase 2